MEFGQIIERAQGVRQMYAKLEQNKFGRSWGASELFQGLVGDVGDLSKLITGKEGMRDIDQVDEKLAHELSDCLWALISIATLYEVDLEKSFLKTMDDIEGKIKRDSSGAISS